MGGSWLSKIHLLGKPIDSQIAMMLRFKKK